MHKSSFFKLMPWLLVSTLFVFSFQNCGNPNTKTIAITTEPELDKKPLALLVNEPSRQPPLVYPVSPEPLPVVAGSKAPDTELPSTSSQVPELPRAPASTEDDEAFGPSNSAPDEYITGFPWLVKCKLGSSFLSMTDFSDTSMSCPRPWLTDAYGGFGSTPSLNKNGGTNSERWAKLTADSKNPKNRVLEFGILKSNLEQKKGRVQMGVSLKRPYPILKFQVRVFLDASIEKLKQFDKSFGWLTLSSVFNDNTWDSDYPFVMSLNIGKPGAAVNSNLHFRLKGRTYFIKESLDKNGKLKREYIAKGTTNEWDKYNEDIVVPVNKWMLLEHEIYDHGVFDEAKNIGRYRIFITPDGKKRQVLFDIEDVTRHPEKQTSQGISAVTPLKLYTGTEEINKITEDGKPLRVQWDDLKIQGCLTKVSCEEIY